jgi:hypothetical protein
MQRFNKLHLFAMSYNSLNYRRLPGARRTKDKANALSFELLEHQFVCERFRHSVQALSLSERDISSELKRAISTLSVEKARSLLLVAILRSKLPI